MTEKYLIEPDSDFIKEVISRGGIDLKKCFQCATCSVACTISPDNKPFPRKEMIAASWGLKDRLVTNHDIWLCHQCGDCSTRCPRGAKPGDVLSAIRSYAITEYSSPKIMSNLINDSRYWPLLFIIPTIFLFVVGYALKAIGLDWFNPTPGGGEIIHDHFFAVPMVEIIFIPLMFFVIAVFALGLKRFLGDIHENASLTGKTDKTEIDYIEVVKAFVRVLFGIVKHDKFTQCSENKDRATFHMMVLFPFIALAAVAGIFVTTLYVLGVPGPYSQLHPVKWLANIAGVSLIIGSIMMIKERLSKTDQVSTYKDWNLLGLVLGLGVTGMLTELTRLGNAAALSYLIYFIHLIFVFNLFVFLPYSKLAHLVYRTAALTYDEYIERES